MGMTKFKFGKDKYHLQEEIRTWCRENFGYGMWSNPKDHTAEWGFDSGFGTTIYYFKQEKHATMFALRWV
jgi:hypothetical protein